MFLRFWRETGSTRGRRLVVKIALLSFGISWCGISLPKADQLDDGVKAYASGDYRSAWDLLRPLADQGVPRAQNGIGVLYATGRGVDHDDAQAVTWFQKSTDQGYSPAQAHLGYAYRMGRGVPKDTMKAVALFQAAAAQGNAAAQTNLAIMYSAGEGVAQHDRMAAELFWKAAEQGNTVSQNNLSSMYARGEGVLRDHVQAAEGYRKAAEQGDASAQIALGASYMMGSGVPRDYVQGYKWLTLGEARYQPWYALFRWKTKLVRFGVIRMRMTGEQLAESERPIAEWRSTHP